jgi:hypothetical protein
MFHFFLYNFCFEMLISDIYLAVTIDSCTEKRLDLHVSENVQYLWRLFREIGTYEHILINMPTVRFHETSS